MRLLAILVTLLSAVLVVGSIPRVLGRFDAVADFVDREFPKFEIRDGVAVGLPTPASHTSARQSHVVLDSRGATHRQGDVVIEKDAFAVRRDTFEAFGFWLVQDDDFRWPKSDSATAGSTEMVSFPFSKFDLGDGVFTGEYCRLYLRSHLWLLVPVFMVLSAFAFVFCMGQSHLFASVGALMEQQFPGRFTYPQVRNLATYAITPAAIVLTVYRLFNLEGLILTLVYLVTYGIFLIGSANACRPRKDEAPVDDSEFY